MAKIQSLLTQAAVIRDATAEGENTALRVGSMFVSLIQSIVATLPPELLDATGISYSAGESNFIITFNSIDDDGTRSTRQIIIPAASQGNAGLLTPTKLKEINEAVSDVAEALEKAISAEDIANSAATLANLAKDTADVALADSASALADAQEAKELAETLSTSVGMPSGIAPLDENRQIPTHYLPAYVDDVIEFGGIVALDISSLIKQQSVITPSKIIYASAVGTFVAVVVAYDAETEITANTYYANWANSDSFGNFSTLGRTPLSGKIYLDTSTNKQYRWSGSTLVVTGSDLALGYTPQTAFPGDEGATLQEEMLAVQEALKTKADNVDVEQINLNLSGIQILPFNGIYASVSGGASLRPPSAGVWWCPQDDGGYFYFVTSSFGYTRDDYNNIDSDAGTTYGRTDRIFRYGSKLYHVEDGELKQLGGASEGNCLNVTVELPIEDTTNPYYDLASAIARIFEARRYKLGLQITFAATASSWKQYQYKGATLESDDFLNEDNWFDMAGTSAGQEVLIDINALCGEPTAADYYSFASAVDALAQYETATKVVYRKEGMVITYRTSDSTWETLQLKRKVGDFGNRAAWEEFGGGSKVETKDEPASGGSDAFSTGGAYNMLPTQHEVTQEDGTVSIQLKNAAGDAVMEPITFLASTGGGGEVSGTVVSIKFEKSPLFGALGAEISTKAAIRSVTMAGSNEVDNAIATLEIIDRDTNLSVWRENVNKPSSTSMEDYSFDIDFTDFFAQAGQKRYILRATDEGGYSATKYITVTAEDITVSVPDSCVLHVRPDAMITPSMEKATIDLFAFYNNQSDKGIEAVVDILINGEWTELHRSVVTDNFVKAVSFSPASLGLTHGAYPIRISGTSLNSGVKGNTVYSAIMVVDADATTPLVAIRYDDRTGGTVKLFESVSLDVAVYNPASNNTIVNVRANDTLITQLLCDNLHTYNVSKQVQGFADGDVIEFFAKVVRMDSSDYRSYEIPVTVSGSVIDAALKEGALYSLDFSSRSNTEADHSIKYGDYELVLTGANYTSNGFVNYLGQNCLRIAENVKGSLNHAPFAAASLEASGMAWQCSFATNNIKDADAKLLECYDAATGAGFYIKGNKVGIYCLRGVQSIEERSFKCGKQMTLSVVIEPSSIYVERSGVKYSAMRMYLDGELVGHIGYIPGRGDLFNSKNITMDGTNGDLYLYYALAYQSHYEWAQAFKNYLVKLVDTDAMIAEFDAENVLASQTAEGTTALRPSAAALWARGVPYVVIVMSEDDFNAFDNGTSTSDNFVADVYYYDPARPWRSFVARKVRIRRQGTTSAKRPKKNVRMYFSKATVIEALFPDYTNEDALLTYALFARKKIRVGENTMAVDLITIKIDFSDAGGANDCGVCDMMNATYRALGGEFMTPAQRFFDGTQQVEDISLSGLEMNHSTANHPIAVFRSTSDTLQNVYFEAKGNWKEDKGEQTALGFMDTPGYNLGCWNYQDESFIEYYGLPDETLDDSKARFRADATLDISAIYLLTEYCGNRYRFMKHDGADWNVMSGSMKQTSGKGSKSWSVSGYVLNPVTGFELLNYQGFCWWRGVPSLDDMMKTGTGLISSWVQKLIDKGEVTADVVPQWTYYFECMVDNDNLAIAYATGKKVPFELYRMLRFCDSCDPDKYASTYAEKWRQHLYKYLNVRSHMAYYTATDYNSLYDQQAKNMQPMFFLEDGAYIEDGVFYNAYGEADNCDVETTPTHALPERMYFNKVYDADGANGKDNDGGCTGDPECDPAKPTDTATGYTNPYAGWNSILWVVLRAVQEVLTDDAGNKIDLRTVVAAMRSVEATVDGKNIKPFSPDGAVYFFLDKRLRAWPKVVSSYDGIRKYVQYTATADAIYFYALQGLGLTSLPDFIERRWRIRDGYYQTGAFFSNYISFRIACASDAVIRFTAAKTGYFGIGNDAPVASSETVYLEAGQSHEFTNFSHQDGALLFIFQADRMSALDLSEVSLSGNASVSFTVMSLVTSLLLGSATHKELNSGYTPMSTAILGNLPFLETLDIRNTGITTVDCSGCPRITKLDARGSALQSFSIAETSPINDIAMPSSLTALKLVGLPKLTYTGLNALTGLRIPSLANIQTLRLESSPKLSARQMLCDTLDGQEATNVLSALRISDMAMKGDASEILEVLDRNVVGLTDGDERSAKPVVNGVYELTTILDQAVINDIESNVEGITIHTVIDAFIELIDEVNAEYYSGDSEVDTVTLDNIGEHLVYYNGETYDEYVARMAEANRSIHDIIQL